MRTVRPSARKKRDGEVDLILDDRYEHAA